MLAADYISIARMCEQYHVLPTAGGLLDQDSMTIHFLSCINEYDSIRQEFDEAQAKGNQ